jgi:hypothetical protein
MPIRPSLAHSHKHLILLQRALYICTFTSISFLTYRYVVYEVTDALQKSSSSFKSSVTDFGYSFLLFSDRMSLIGLGDPLRWPRDTIYPQKLALTSPTSGGRSVGIVRLRTEATEFREFYYWSSAHKKKREQWTDNRYTNLTIVISGTGYYNRVSEAVPTIILHSCYAGRLFAGWVDARVFGYAKALHRLLPFLLGQLRSQGKRSNLEQWSLCTCTYAFHRIRCILHNCGTGCRSHAVVVLNIRGTSSCVFSRSSQGETTLSNAGITRGL